VSLCPRGIEAGGGGAMLRIEAGRVFCTSSGYKRQRDGKLQLGATNSEGKRFPAKGFI